MDEPLGFDEAETGFGKEQGSSDCRKEFSRSKTFDTGPTESSCETTENKGRWSSEIELVHLSADVSDEKDSSTVYSFTVEECILLAHEGHSPLCPTHGSLALEKIAPDTVFMDISEKHLILPEQVKRGKMLGRGAFGFVFKAQVKHKDGVAVRDVALKMLQPVDPGFGARQTAVTAYKAAWSKWQRDPWQYACRAYCTARQELNVLSHLRHPNIVPMVGVCPRPLALVVCLAPLGGLNSLLQNYKRSGARLNFTVLQESLAQVSRGLEYLHQEHIIYRDLKSENVLVWQFPPPFSLLTSVDLKLGDYGISRSIFPAGGAKGFGGTEGFMAPEIMRYNGEEEYTEKVDCFSFGMFLYELLTLKLPFEGQEQVKEFLLDGGRPQLAPNELLYPCNILDLMVVCWSQQPMDRPSASQLVSITTAPEFSHLVDVVSLNDSDAAVLVGEAFTVDDSSMEEIVPEGSLEGELWLSRADGQISVLSCSHHGWLDYKNIYVNEDSFVTAMCLVEDTVWLGELTGVVRVFCAKTYCELYSFPLAPHILPKEESPKHQLSLAVSSILSLTPLRLVLVVTGQPAALLLCRMLDNLGGLGTGDPVLVTAKIPFPELHCVTALPERNDSVELWTGESSGFISIFSVIGGKLKEVDTMNHYSPQIDGVEVYRLVSSQNDGRYVWSYVFPGSVLYQWDVGERVIIAKLDCSKIVPCSESINTINIEEKMSPGRCQISSMCLVEKEGGGQLYMGTTWGVVIVAEADQLKPVTAFRTHLEDVRVIVPLDSCKRPVLFQQSPIRERQSSTTTTNISSSNKQRHSWNTKATTSSSSHGKDRDHTQRKADNKLRGNFILTVGKGYRCLIQRFLDNYREEPQVLDCRNKDFFAVIWRTDDWVL